MEEKVKAILMLEILGRPAEHVKDTLNKVVDKLGSEKDVKIINKKILEPKKVEGEKAVFTSFAEIEIETPLNMLMLLIFGYMPSHVEIIEPENIKMKMFDLNSFLNDLIKKLHFYDEIAKTFLMERQVMAKQIQEGKIRVETVKKKPAGKKTKKGSKKKKN